MNTELNPEYRQELDELESKMLKAQAFAERLPLFREKIISGKLTGENEYYDFGKSYKKLHLGWGINFWRFNSETGRYVCNYGKKHDEWLFSLYFNSYSIFDEQEEYGLSGLAEVEGVFFFDRVNSHFYVRESHIEQFLEAAVVWHAKAWETKARLAKEKEEDDLKVKLTMLGYSVTKP